MRKVLPLVLIFSVQAVFFPGRIPGHNAREVKNLIKQVDHILLAPDDPKALFIFLTKELNLPVAWPYRDYGGFASGGVSVGDVNLETLMFEGTMADTPSKIIGIAFEPDGTTAEIVRLLDRRGIMHLAPETSAFGPEGKRTPMWTTTLLKNMLPGSLIFFCEYHFIQSSVRRKFLKKSLKKIQGGPMRIKRLSEIAIKINKKEAVLPDWDNLLVPHHNHSHNFFLLNEGPSIRFLEGKKDQISSLKFKVESLRNARDFLSEKGLLGIPDKKTARTDPEKFWGIVFEFSE